MKTRLFADLAAFARAACTHASNLDREVPLVPFYVREHAVGWLRPSFADLLRRWPHHFEVTASYATLRASPDTVHGRTAAMTEVTACAREGGRHPRLARRAGERLPPLRGAGAAARRALGHAPLRHDGLRGAPQRLHAPRRRALPVDRAARGLEERGPRPARQPRGRAHRLRLHGGRDHPQGGVGGGGNSARPS